MTIVGITGGIGSGKSVICRIVNSMRFKTYDADKEAKLLTESSSDIKKGLINSFGEDIYIHNRLNKEKLSSLIFNNDENLQRVNSIVHPIVKKHLKEWFKRHSQEKFLFVESAILYESGFNTLCDKTITVYAPMGVRIERVKERSSISEEKIKSIIENQISEEEKISKSDFVIYNDDTLSLINQTKDIIEQIYQGNI